jgi:hypothetical protein
LPPAGIDSGEDSAAKSRQNSTLGLNFEDPALLPDDPAAGETDEEPEDETAEDCTAGEVQPPETVSIEAAVRSAHFDGFRRTSTHFRPFDQLPRASGNGEPAKPAAGGMEIAPMLN